MNYKPLLLLGGLFVLLLAAFFLVKSGRPEIGGPNEDLGKVLVQDFKPDQARIVKLAKGDHNIDLALKDGKWVIASKDDRPADSDRVKRLLDAVRDAKVKDARTGSLETFELDDKHRLAVDVLGPDDKNLAGILAGKSPNYGMGFVLKDDRILEIDQNFSDHAQVKTEDENKVLSVDKWYDLKLLRVTSSDVIDVSFQKGDEKWRIQKVIPGKGPVKPGPDEPERKADENEASKDEAKQEPAAEAKKDDAADKKDDVKKDAEAKKEEPKAEEKKEKKEEEKKPVWRITEPEDMEANESECDGVCSALAWLDAKGYADEFKPEEQGFDKPIATTRFVLKDGTTHTFVFGKYVKDEKSDYDSFVIAKLDDKPQVWKIGKTDYEKFTKPLDKLKKAKEEEKKDEKADAKAEDKKDESKAEEKKDEKPAEKKSEETEKVAPKAEETAKEAAKKTK